SKFVRRYAQLTSTMKGSILTNAGIGLVAGAAIGKFVKYGFVAALPGAGLAVLGGASVGKALLTSNLNSRAGLHKDIQRRADEDARRLDDLADFRVTTAEGGTADYAQLFSDVTSEVAADRIEKDVRGNKRRAMIAGVAGGAAVLGGALL